MDLDMRRIEAIRSQRVGPRTRRSRKAVAGEKTTVSVGGYGDKKGLPHQFECAAHDYERIGTSVQVDGARRCIASVNQNQRTGLSV